jgi:hypothetical protein
MVRATENLEQQIRLYESQSDSLARDLHAASARDIEAVVAYANFIYDRLKRIDEERSAELDATGAVPSEADARATEGLYRKWVTRAEADLRRAAEFEARGQRIAGLDRFRRAYYEAKDVLSIPVERVRSSARSAREGRTRDLREIRDELRGPADR